MSTCFLHVPDPDDQPFDDDEPNKPIAPGDRWCSLWAPREPGGPRLPCHPSIEGTADKWLLIAGAIEAGAPRAFGRVAFAPAAGGGELWSPHNSTGDRDHVRLTTAELVELAADIRAKLAPPDRDLKPGNVSDPDVIASAPRPTVADDPNRHPFWPASDRCRICDRVECRRRELSIAYYRLDDRGKPKRGKDAEWLAALEALAPVADECARLRVDWRAEALGWRAKAATPPTLPADLRGLLDALVAAQDARDAADVPGGDGIAWGRCDAEHEDAVRAVAEWHRGAGGGR